MPSAKLIIVKLLDFLTYTAFTPAHLLPFYWAIRTSAPNHKSGFNSWKTFKYSIYFLHAI